MRRLSRQATPDGALLGASAGDATGIVHLGLGNFHRAHAAVYTAHALAAEPGEWGDCGVYGFANRSHDVVSAMRAQDGRYSILELSDQGRRAGVIDVHRSLGVLADDPEGFVAAIADPAHRILTLTVSEVGYCRSARTGTLDVERDDVRSDIADPTHPRSTIGLIARGLAVRAASGAPITVLSCDNLQSNGRATRAVLTEFLHASAASGDVLNFVDNHVTFPNSMVDRLVPGTTAQTVADVAGLMHVDDRCPVPAEDFTMWVLEDHFAAGRPASDRAGAIMSDEVEAYELVKLRLLNGSHSLIAYLGLLDGHPTIADAWAQGFVRDAVRACIANEYLPSITLPRGFDVDVYVDSLSHRWANSALGHRTSQVCTDGSVGNNVRSGIRGATLMDVVAARSRRVRQPRQNGKYFVIPSPTGPGGSGRRRGIRQGQVGGLKTDLQPRPGTAQRLSTKGSGRMISRLCGARLPSIGQFLSGSAQ